MDWNDIRFFVAVADHGSTLAAGRALGVSQTTVARRIAALERSLGLVLFDRRQAGYTLTPAGEALLETARTVRDSSLAFETAAASLSRRSGGTVRLSVGDIFANTFLPPWLALLHEAHPDIRLELDESDEVRDLAGGEADVALRSTEDPAAGYAPTTGPSIAAATTPSATASPARART